MAALARLLNVMSRSLPGVEPGCLRHRGGTGGPFGRPRDIADEPTEFRIVPASVGGEAKDGTYSRLIPYVDGTSDGMQAALITMLHQIVENGLKEYDRGF